MKFFSIFLIVVLAISLVGLFNFNYAFASHLPAEPPDLSGFPERATPQLLNE